MGSLRGVFSATAVRVDSMARRGLLFLAVYILSILLLAAGVGLLFGSLYLWLVMRLGNPVALLITACVVLLSALIFLMVWWFVGRPKLPPKTSAEVSTAEIQTLEADVDRLTQDLDRMVRKNAPSFTLAAFALGIAIGVSPKLRRGVMRWLK
ncbi:hypothetical protein [Methylohalobius crimeensis]|uniref:hypothetical protein n=1 Tax=Methylohalobius crimeensis TaxID=244365 RepID=UPI001268FD10|nr:hypothetical protein [Methylohalobius crimeensis]